MKNNLNKKSKNNIKVSKKIFYTIIFIVLVYIIVHLINLYQKLDSYNAEIAYYEEKIESLKKKQEELESIQANVNSPEYIEQMARENLDMSSKDEEVFVGINEE